jgi:hypothetical protein
MKMNGSRSLLALVSSIAGLAFCGSAISMPASDVAPPAAQVALAHGADSLEFSAQGRRGGGNVGRTGGGNAGRVGRQGGGNVGRVGRQGGNVGRVGMQGRVGRIDGRVGRVGRIDGRVGRVGRVGYRYGRVGRIGFIPVPVPLPSGPGIMLPIAPAVPAVPCPVCPVQACLVAVFADPNLTGQALETRDNQPRLDLNGWQNQISSIQVRSGTWDFYPELEFRGQALRLAPGSYGILEPQWTKRIGSFMCVK